MVIRETKQKYCWKMDLFVLLYIFWDVLLLLLQFAIVEYLSAAGA